MKAPPSAVKGAELRQGARCIRELLYCSSFPFGSDWDLHIFRCDEPPVRFVLLFLRLAFLKLPFKAHLASKKQTNASASERFLLPTATRLETRKLNNGKRSCGCDFLIGQRKTLPTLGAQGLPEELPDCLDLPCLSNSGESLTFCS